MVSSTTVIPVSVTSHDISDVLAMFCCNTAGDSGGGGQNGGGGDGSSIIVISGTVVIVDLDGADAGADAAVIMLCCIQ
eukprot:10484036-Ditylum_brightwellii.AAC.1